MSASPPITLRPEQEAALAAIFDGLAHGITKPVVSMATGTGKTVMFAELLRRRGGPALVLAHREELIQQAAATIRRVWPDAPVGIVRARDDNWTAPVVVGSIASLQPRRLRRWAPDRFATVVVDECFPAGTWVGDRLIETLRVGDTVPSWDPGTQTMTTGVVTHVFRRHVSAPLLRLETQSLSVDCTPNHPFYTPAGWVPAAQLKVGDTVLVSGGNRLHDTMSMSSVRHSSVGHQSSDSLSDMFSSPAAQTPILHEGDLFELQSTHDNNSAICVCPLSQNRASLLLRHLPRPSGFTHEFRTRHSHQQEMGCRTDADQESHVAGHGTHKDDGRQTSAGKLEAPVPRRQRSSPTQTPAVVSRAVRVGYGSRGSDPLATRFRLSRPLSDRHCGSHTDDRDRSRRGQSPKPGTSSSGREENGLPQWARVEHITVLESGGFAESGRLCRDHRDVYNLAVSPFSTYTANGFVVHNCHHTPAAQYRHVLEYLTPALLLGVTATPFRSDRASLAQIFDRVVYAFGIQDAIAAGTLVDLIAYQVRTRTNLDTVRVEAGDFLAGDLDRVLNTDERNTGIVAGYQAYTPGRRAVAFCAGVSQAEALAATFTHHGIPAAAVHGGLPGAERARRLAGLSAGDLPVVTSVGVLTEGWDEPRLESLLLARPTKSLALYTQMVGRVLRTAPGKRHGTLLDFVDATQRHRLVTVRDLFGLQRLPPSGASLTQAVSAEQADREAFAELATRLLPSVDRTAVTDLFARFADTAIPPEVDWRDVLDDLPARHAHRTPASPAQVKALVAFGWPFDEAAALSARQAYEALTATLTTQQEWAAVRAPLWADLTAMPARALRDAYYSRPWHFQRPTPKQVAWCRHHGIHLPAGCTAGEVSLLIDHHQRGAPRNTPYTPPPSKGASHASSPE